MRIDKFLKVSRIIKRRTVAAEACANGRVTINDRVAKAGAEIHIGDEVTITFGDKVFAFRVLSVSETARKDEAASMFEVLTDRLEQNN